MIRNTLLQILTENPRLDRCIVFENGGTVLIATGKV